MRILIITGGRTDIGFALGLFKKETFDVVILADSALEIWDKMGEIPGFTGKIDHLVGDFDSVSPKILEKYINREDIVAHRFNPEKDYTDTEIAVRLAIRLAREAGKEGAVITLLGATGTRMDHSLANLALLLQVHAAGMEGRILDENNRIRLLEGEIRLGREEAFGGFFSLLPVTPVLRCVTIEGAKYPLSGRDVRMGESICVSNEFEAEQVRIRIEEGSALLIESRD